jgi:hypothetical protein
MPRDWKKAVIARKFSHSAASSHRCRGFPQVDEFGVAEHSFRAPLLRHARVRRTTLHRCAADGVGQVEILDRIIGDLARHLGFPAWVPTSHSQPILPDRAQARPSPSRRAVHRGCRTAALAQHIRKRAENRPILARVARREDGALTALDAAFEVHPGARISRCIAAPGNTTSALRAIVAMMADIDFEALGKEAVITSSAPRKKASLGFSPPAP